MSQFNDSLYEYLESLGYRGAYNDKFLAWLRDLFPSEAPWILTSGEWNDTGAWRDEFNWNDGV